MSSGTLLSAKDVAKQLNVDYETVRRWLESGKLKGSKVGKLWRVKESDLNSFFKPNTG